MNQPSPHTDKCDGMKLPELPPLPEPDFENHDNGDVFGCEKTYFLTPAQIQAYATTYAEAAVKAELASMPEPPDDGELEAWRATADLLLHTHRSMETRRAAHLLQNAYLFGKAIRARSKE